MSLLVFQLVMESVESILAKCSSISWTVAQVKTNKNRCRRLADSVRAMEGLVESLSQTGPRHVSLDVSRALRYLLQTLTSAHDLVKKFTSKAVNTLKYDSEFVFLHERLSEYHHVLSKAVQENATPRTSQGLRMDDDDDDDYYADGRGFFGANASTKARFKDMPK